MLTNYVDLPVALRRAFRRGQGHLVVELHHPSHDDIWEHPETAYKRFAIQDTIWNDLDYAGKMISIPSFSRFIDRQFNTLNLDLLNIERGINSAGMMFLKEYLKGYRVAIRAIFKGAAVEETRFVWWGRLNNLDKLNEKQVTIACSQELGDFSYEVATDKFGQRCPKIFGYGDCLGDETLEQKSPLFRQALAQFQQGGCDRTNARCILLGNQRLFGGQVIVVSNGTFIRVEEIVKRILWIFKKTKLERISVPFTSQNLQSDDQVIPYVFGRTLVEGIPFTYQDRGVFLDALQGVCRGGEFGIKDIILVQSMNPSNPVFSYDNHLGTYGGVGLQVPDNRFPQSGFNSELAYAGTTYHDQSTDANPTAIPPTRMVVKGSIMPVLNRLTGQFENVWNINPAWSVYFALTKMFRYKVIPENWFNHQATLETADDNFRIVEDDTNADIKVVTDTTGIDLVPRYNPTTRYNAASEMNSDLASRVESFSTSASLNLQIPEPSDERPPIIVIPTGTTPQIENKTFLTLKNSLNGAVSEQMPITNLMYDYMLPVMRGFLHFSPFGKVEIRKKLPVQNTFIRFDYNQLDNKIPVTNIKKIFPHKGFLCIGAGQRNAEINEAISAYYVNTAANATVSGISTGGTTLTVSPRFEQRGQSAAFVKLDFSGTPTAGEIITFRISEVVDGQPRELIWDYVVEALDVDLATLVKVFKTRLEASMSFEEFWTAEIPFNNPYQIIVKLQTGYLKLKNRLYNEYEVGDEIINVVEVYENNKDQLAGGGENDNIVSFELTRPQKEYHGVKVTFISAVDGFKKTEVIPHVAWSSVLQERNLELMELDFRFCDSYAQAAREAKSFRIDYVEGNLPAILVTNNPLAIFHQENDVIAVKYQTFEGQVSYLPFQITQMNYDGKGLTKLTLKLYLSAAYDRRIAREETFVDNPLSATNQNPEFAQQSEVPQGGFSRTGTGDGGFNSAQNIKFEPKPYFVLPEKHHTRGRDTI